MLSIWQESELPFTLMASHGTAQRQARLFHGPPNGASSSQSRAEAVAP